MKKYQHYIDLQGDVLPTPDRNNDSCFDLQIIWKIDLRFILILANSAYPDEIEHYAAFHLSLHCFPMCPFRGFQYTKG